MIVEHLLHLGAIHADSQEGDSTQNNKSEVHKGDSNTGRESMSLTAEKKQKQYKLFIEHYE